MFSNVTKAFYSASLLFDVLGQFEAFTEEVHLISLFVINIISGTFFL